MLCLAYFFRGLNAALDDLTSHILIFFIAYYRGLNAEYSAFNQIYGVVNFLELASGHLQHLKS